MGRVNKMEKKKDKDFFLYDCKRKRGITISNYFVYYNDTHSKKEKKNRLITCGSS